MGKNYTLNLAINALLQQNFFNAFKAAASTMAGLKNKAAEMAMAQNSTSAMWSVCAQRAEAYRLRLQYIERQYRSGIISQKEYARSTKYLTEQMRHYQAEANKHKGSMMNNASGMLGNAGSQVGLMAGRAGAAMATFDLWLASAKTVATPFMGMVDTAIQFEAAITKVGAISRASETDMKRLSATAQELGASTKFSATQAAEAMSYLGMAGWNTEQIISGMPGLLALAAAGNTDLARTADIVSDDLTAFGMSADQSGKLADAFAYIITRTNTNVEMLGETMKYAAPIANAFGASMEETTTLTGLMANAGIKATQAGTALRAGFLRLAGPPTAAAKELEALGISASDCSKEQAEVNAELGNMGIKITEVVDGVEKTRKVSDIVRDLAKAMEGMGKTEKLSKLKTIFGTTAASAWQKVFDAGADKIEEMTAGLEKSGGEADKLAKRMQDCTQGAMTTFKSAMEGIAISIGSVFLPQIAEAFKVMAKYAGQFAVWAKEHPKIIGGIIAIAGAVGALITVILGANVAWHVFLMLKTGILVLKASFLAIKPIIMAVFGTTGALVAGTLAAVAAIYYLYNNWDEACAFMWSLWDKFCNYIVYGVGYICGWFAQLPERIAYFFSHIDEIGANFVTSAGEWGKNAVNAIIEWFMSLPGRLSDVVSAAWNRAKLAFNAGYTTATTVEAASNATGGIYNKGAFLTTFAEEGPEAAIPLDGSPRAVGLWQRAGELLGQRSSGGGEYNISIPITVNGGADSSTVQNIGAQVEAAVRRALENIQHENRRLSLA